MSAAPGKPPHDQEAPAGAEPSDAEVVSEGEVVEPSATGAEEAPEASSAEDPMAAVAAERDEYLDALRRMKAEFDNYRRRAERDRQNASAAAAREVVRGLLPVMDNLERAVAALGDQAEGVVAGVEMVRAQLAGVLTGHGVSVIAADAETEFDPNLHEAIAQIPAPDAPAGRILEVVEKGYLHAELVLRPAKVVVAAEPPAG
ncbi:MAG: nucleotide exchange factor GrpE [Miltoncostaeaceae bacterium]